MEFFENRIEQYNVRPTQLYGELKKDFDKTSFTEKINNSYFLNSLEKKDVVPYMRYWHELNTRVRIIIEVEERQIYQVSLEKPFLSLKKNLLKSKDDLFLWYKRTNVEAQEFINAHYDYLKMEKPFVFSQPSDEEINRVVAQILEENPL